MQDLLVLLIVSESGRGIPRVKHQIRLLSVENDQGDARRDGRTRLARPNSQARTGAGKKTFSAISNDHGTFNARPSFSHTNYGYKVNSTINRDSRREQKKIWDRASTMQMPSDKYTTRLPIRYC